MGAPLLTSAQSELAVTPGAGTLNEAIANDTDRPDDRVYVLERGGVYPLTDVVSNDGFVLRIKAADGDGVRPVIYPGQTDSGSLGSRFFELLDDTYLTGVYVLGVAESGDQKGMAFDLSGEGMRFVADSCVFEGGNSRYFEVNAANTRITIQNSQVRNLVRPDNLSNGRAIDYRDVPGDSLFIQNTSFLNVTGFVVRFGTGATSTALEHFIFDHNTVHTTSNDLTDSGVGRRAVEYTVTNNLFVNVNGPGESPSDNPDGILQVAEFDGSGFVEADRSIRIAYNGMFTSQEVLDYYQSRADAGDPIVPLQLIQPSSQEFIDGSAQATAEGNLTDPVDFQAPPRLDSYVAFLPVERDGTGDPPFWAFGTDDDLFPVEQPLPEDLSYAETDVAYTAAEKGFPLGDLNWFPTLKALFDTGAFAVSSDGQPEDGRAVALLGTYPNPSAGDVTVVLALGASAEVSVEVIDLLGRVVSATPSQTVAAGDRQPVSLDVSDLSAGVYLARVTVASEGSHWSESQRITVAR